MILYDSRDRSGFEYVISVRINKYGKTANHFAGVALGFDGDSMIIAYPIMLTSDLSLMFDSPFVKSYFESCYKEFKKQAPTGRILCQQPALLLKLASKLKAVL